jgi:N-acetyl-anhydromuramyl-L-alanine amidase AmpD
MRRSKFDIQEVILHCASTPNGLDHYTIKDIDDWHRVRGFLRDRDELALCSSDHFHVGYHYVIEVDGRVEPGRHLLEVGAHCRGRNRRSIGICMVGEDRFTRAQWTSLRGLIAYLEGLLGPLKKHGHREFDEERRRNNGCPCFDVSEWVCNSYIPLDVNVCEVK